LHFAQFCSPLSHAARIITINPGDANNLLIATFDKAGSSKNTNIAVEFFLKP